MNRGFSLLEVLVALVILSLAIVTLIQLSSRGLHLLRLADDYQHAVLLAERVARGGDVVAERVDSGREGFFRWERRVVAVLVPEALDSGAGTAPRLYALSVAVRWGNNHQLELASLRTITEDTAASEAPGR